MTCYLGGEEGREKIISDTCSLMDNDAAGFQLLLISNNFFFSLFPTYI